MRKLLSIGLVFIAVLAFAAEPAFQHLSHSGAVFTYVGGAGTNSVIEVNNATNLIPWRIQDITATTNGVACAVKVYRVWNFQRLYKQGVITTNFFGTTETNYYHAFVNSYQTNEVYDSASDTPPMPEVFVINDIVRIDCQSVTNAIIRMTGSAP